MPVRPLCFTASSKVRLNVLMSPVAIAKAYDPANPPKDQTHKKFDAIWDTGATNTVITGKVVQECGLRPIGMTKVHHGGGEDEANTYLVNIGLPNRVMVCNIKATELKLVGRADVLIGMDIIGQGDFAVTNKDHETVFSFRIPSVECIDFVKQPYKQEPIKASFKTGRNDLCPCGSGKKYKNCCLNKNN